MSMNRRDWLKVSALGSGGLLLQMTLPVAAEGPDHPALVRSKELNVYLQIDASGEITIYSATPEMGQGIKTTLPMIIAEEMGARWEDVTVIDAPEDMQRFGMQGAGGSMSVPRQIGSMRRMGASAREMLIGAAALLMEVEREDLQARDSRVIHKSGAERSFGQLASLAVQQPVPDPETLTFKDPDDYTIIGTSVTGVDNLVIASGRSQFGIDVELEGMHYANYTSCPRVGGKAVKFNADEIRALPGITHAFILEPNADAGKAQMFFIDGMAKLRGGVAIVGEDTWSVLDAKSKLDVQWDFEGASTDTWEGQIAQARDIVAAGGGEVRLDNAAVEPALANPDNTTVEGFYQFPYVSHICMEPMNCTADYRAGKNGADDTLEVWVGSQFPAQIKELAGNFLGLKPENVTVHPLRMGGGFGRRAIHDYATEAIAISHHVGVPVKMTWTRTDDIHNDWHRVGGFEQMRGAVDPAGKLAAWDQHYIGYKYANRTVIGSGLRGNEFPMVALANARVRQSMMDFDTQCGAWRAPGSNTNAFVEQSFIHELAHAAGRDHLEFLLELMGARRWIKEGDVNALNTGRAIDVSWLRLGTVRARQSGNWRPRSPIRLR
ncbi:MAG: molybdopterin cofactor-binding domain-containing protein, partial [Pseudomonadota bacterium]